MCFVGHLMTIQKKKKRLHTYNVYIMTNGRCFQINYVIFHHYFVMERYNACHLRICSQHLTIFQEPIVQSSSIYTFSPCISIHAGLARELFYYSSYNRYAGIDQCISMMCLLLIGKEGDLQKKSEMRLNITCRNQTHHYHDNEMYKLNTFRLNKPASLTCGESKL